MKEITASELYKICKLFFENNLLGFFFRFLQEEDFRGLFVSCIKNFEYQHPGRVFREKVSAPYQSRQDLNLGLKEKGVAVMSDENLLCLTPPRWVTVSPGIYEWILVEPGTMMNEADAREEIARRGLEPLNADEGMLFLDTCYSDLRGTTVPIVCLNGGHYEGGEIHGHLVFNSFLGKITPIIARHLTTVCAFAAKRKISP